MKPLFSCSLLLLVIAASFSAGAQAPADKPAYAALPDFQKARASAIHNQHTTGNALFAIGDWRKANKIAGGHCTECFTGMINAANIAGEYKQGAQVAREMEAAAETPRDRAIAEIYLGRELIAVSGSKKPNVPVLEEAHAALEKSETVGAAAYLIDGKVLSMLRREPEAAVAFQKYADDKRQDASTRARAARFALHPALAREPSAPIVAVNTLGGKHFDLDNMDGKVVLIDFWATWCGPCKQELPRIKKLAQEFANEPFEIISISWDADETAWKDFIAANGMTWNHYLDKDHSLTNTFGINAIPHYFTIDSNGVLTGEILGSDSNIDGRIRKLIKQAKDDREKLTAANNSAGLQ